MVELNGDHGDRDDHKIMIKCSTFGKEGREKTKMGSRHRYNHRSHFWSGDQDTIESVITLRIDSRTIKRGESRLMWLLSATR